MPLLPLEMLTDVFPGLKDLSSRLIDRSRREYCQDAQHYLAWCAWDQARALEPQSLRAWRTHMVNQTRLSPNTINRRLAAIKCLVTASAKCEALDPAVAFRFDQVESVSKEALRARLKPRRALQPEQVRVLCRAPDANTLEGLRDRALLMTLASSGCRLSEVLTLTVHQLVLAQAGWVLEVLGKRQVRPRRAPLSAEAYGWVQRWLQARAKYGVAVAWVFTTCGPHDNTPMERPLHRTVAYRRIRAYGREVGLPHLMPHDLRRFVGTQVAAKHGIREAQKVLGHARLETTAQHYVLDELQPGLTEGLY